MEDRATLSFESGSRLLFRGARGVQSDQQRRAGRERSSKLRPPGSRFLDDVISDRLRFTGLSRKSPILDALAYLNEAFRYNLKVEPDDWLKKIVQEFNPEPLKQNKELRREVEKEATKLFTQTIDVERSWNILESLGLRKKLMNLSDDREFLAIDRADGQGALEDLSGWKVHRKRPTPFPGS